MRMSGPYYEDRWDLFPQTQTAETEKSETVETNSPRRILWELGVVLMVPLSGAALVELVLHAVRIY